MESGVLGKYRRGDQPLLRLAVACTAVRINSEFKFEFCFVNPSLHFTLVCTSANRLSNKKLKPD